MPASSMNRNALGSLGLVVRQDLFFILNYTGGGLFDEIQSAGDDAAGC